MAHDILEVPKVPRQKAELTALLNDARFKRKRARLKRIVAVIIVVLAIMVLLARLTGLLHPLGTAVLYLGGIPL